MRRTESRLMLLTVLVVLAVTVIGTALADPVGTGTLTPGVSSTGTDPSDTAGQLDAAGGNVTEINISSESITDKWAGYYGQITGELSLEDSAGNVFYNWTDASPTGQVYATRESGTPTWSSIECANITHVEAEATAINLTSGMDNITNTYGETRGNHSAFNVGATSFAADECAYRTNVFNQSGSQNVDWDQVLLYEGSNILYTTIINQDTNGFNSANQDFQLLVGEQPDSDLTTYYFYIELV